MEIYENAPIVEAGLDVRVRLADPSNVDHLKSIRDAKYPNLFRVPVNIQFTVEGNAQNVFATASNTPIGFWYRTVDEKNVFQVRTDGFTHNRLAPYRTWAEFSQEARRLWLSYKAAANPVQIELIGLNYINEFLLPVGRSFGNHFKTYIEVPVGIPQTISAFSMNYQVELENSVGTLQISQAYGIPKKLDFVTVNLNIHVFRILNIPSSELDEMTLWSMFQELRAAKDNAFEACITDEIRGMIR